MTSSILLQSLAFLLLLTSRYCHEHHNKDGDNKWSVFVSHIQSFWKTEPSESQTESFVPTKTPITEKDSSHYHHSHKTTDENTNSHTRRIETLNGTITLDNVERRVTLGLAWLISLPIVGIILLCCFCYCCCKCCASLCSSEEKVIVMNSHVIAPPQQPQVIVQQPIIQNMVAPRDMQQFPPQNPQWGHHQNFQQPPPQYYPAGGVDNPNFHYPTAPNQISPDKY